MMWTVLLLYALCWGPVKVFQLLRHFRVISYCSQVGFYALLSSYIACHWLAMANSFGENKKKFIFNTLLC